MIHTGDCLEVMPTLAAGSVDAVVTDPPYDLTGHRWDSLAEVPGHSASRQSGGFMGKAWDGTGVAFRPDVWREALRVTAPGGYLLAFGGTRTYHRMTCAIEDAGWIIRDCLVWAYASGFPKSKALLKPAWEPIVMARKPGPLRELAIDACRIGYVSEAERAEVNARTGPNSRHRPQIAGGTTPMSALGERHVEDVTHPAGRWPANLILTDPIFDGDTPGVVGGGETTSGDPGSSMRNDLGWFGEGSQPVPLSGYGDSGTYSRFFLIPKADRAEREPLLPLLPLLPGGSLRGAETRPDRPTNHPHRQNTHPTVKPLDLMRHLVRLVTPTGGRVLDPFLGSGTTALAAEMEGFDWIGIEREPEYVAIAEARLAGTQRGLGLPA